MTDPQTPEDRAQAAWSSLYSSLHTARAGLEIDQLRALKLIQDELTRTVNLEVSRLRTRGISWADIGRAFGITASGAQQKWKHSAPRERYRSTYTPVKGDSPI